MSCACGCGGEPRERSRYAADACRARVYRRKHPLLEDVVPEASPDEVRAAWDEFIRGREKIFEDAAELATRMVELASHPIAEKYFGPSKKRKSRQTTKPRRHACDISPEHARKLGRVADSLGVSRRDTVESMIDYYATLLVVEDANEAANPF